TCWNGADSGNGTNLVILFPNKLRACRNVELHEVIRDRCSAGVFARFTYSIRHFWIAAGERSERGTASIAWRYALAPPPFGPKGFRLGCSLIMSPRIFRNAAAYNANVAGFTVATERAASIHCPTAAMLSAAFCGRCFASAASTPSVRKSV